MDDLAVVSFAGGLEPSQKPPTSMSFSCPVRPYTGLQGFRLRRITCAR
ncbi:hypothetical protein DAI22_03g218450 [Oryza sativa Japonica Group]|nr:hypothetical protein DAI22_03g218450 [Oryza sativa Japonica Group]